MATALAPALSFAIHEDGTLEVVSPWFPCIEIHVNVLARADARRLIVRGDELEFRCTNGGALYTLGPADARGMRDARLVRAWG